MPVCEYVMIRARSSGGDQRAKSSALAAIENAWGKKNSRKILLDKPSRTTLKRKKLSHSQKNWSKLSIIDKRGGEGCESESCSPDGGERGQLRGSKILAEFYPHYLPEF